MDDNLNLYGLTQVLVPLAGAVFNIAIQYFCFKLIAKSTLLKSVYIGFFSGILFLASFELFIFFTFPESPFVDSICLLIVNLIIYSCLGYQYFNIISLGETARRIRIMREIYEAENGLTYLEILECYNARYILEVRLARLLNNRQIAFRNGRYFIENNTMAYITKFISVMKIIVLGKKSEFD